MQPCRRSNNSVTEDSPKTDRNRFQNSFFERETAVEQETGDGKRANSRKIRDILRPENIFPWAGVNE